MMNKGTQNKKVIDITNFAKSSFTLTFAVEILGIDVWHDCNEGWLDLGPCHQALKIQYQLYPEQSYDLDILIWPHVAKIWCGGQYGYVRTWQFLERRWLAFSIRHAFPVRVLDFLDHVATVSCTMGFSGLSNNAKNDKNIEVYLPPLKFGEQRYFGTVLEEEYSVTKFVQDMIWKTIEEKIQASYLDGNFNTPQNVTDIRHQNAIIYNVKEIIFKNNLPVKEEQSEESEETIRPKTSRESKTAREKEKKKVAEIQKEKFLISLSGDSILSGAGRIISFQSTGERPQDQSEIVVLVSSNNLPSHDDLPIIIVNIENLNNIPIINIKNARIAQLYTRWEINGEYRESQKQYVRPGKPINFNDHHAVPLKCTEASNITATFLDKPFEVQLRGLRNAELIHSHQTFFENNKNDRNFDFKLPSNSKNEEMDVLIAVTKIDASILAKNKSTVVAGEFSLYPPEISREECNREDISTNDVNSVKVRELLTRAVIPPSIVLDANMTLDVSIGLVGCKPRELSQCYSRLYCLVRNSDIVMRILQKILEINRSLTTDNKSNLLTGFAIDTGDVVLFFIEGQKDKTILKIWKLIVSFYPKIKNLFFCSEQYHDRIYTETTILDEPFNISIMFVPLNTLLGCPQVYVRPTLPLHAKSALLKIGRIVASNLKRIPFKSEMPTEEELKSFRLELCVSMYHN